MSTYGGYIDYAGIQRMLKDVSTAVDESVERMKHNEVSYVGYRNGRFLEAKM